MRVRAGRPGGPSWIISNPVCVGHRVGAREHAQPVVSSADRSLFDGKSLGGWSRESDSASAAAIDIATLLSGPAVDRLKNGPIRDVVVTNSLPVPSEKHFDTLTVLSIAPIVADALTAVFEERSVSELFSGDNQ